MLASTVQKAVAKKYIPEWIKLDFSNDSNLKYDIQNRITPNIKSNFLNALKNIKGDNKDGSGVSFSEITLLAMAYFYSEIFKDKMKDSYYSLEMVKGFLDADNHSNYTAIYEIDVEFFKLNDASLFRHCWLINQSAWYFNSEHFGHHQYIDYINHFIKTGEKLPIANYKFDKLHLEKKYSEFEKEINNKKPLNEFKLVSDWYFGILFLVCNELKLPTTHFTVKLKDNREFNPLTKTTKVLRNLAPFKIIECDIESAFPTFLDIEVKSNLKDNVYNNLMLSRNITRGEAKILFITYCNNGQYKSKEETVAFFVDCGYTFEQSSEIIEMTHHSTIKFYSFMTEQESNAIEKFIYSNDLNRGARLHDAVFFIDNGIKPQILTIKPNCDFGYKVINRPVIQESFSLSGKRLPYAYISSIPQNINLVKKYDGVKSEIKGHANGFVFYKEKYEYLNAYFNINDYTIDYDKLVLRLHIMFSRLLILNKKETKSIHIYDTLKHIRANSQYVFNVRALYCLVVKFQYNSQYIYFKERNYGITKQLLFKKKIEFLLARNEAEKIVNTTNNLMVLFCLIEERIGNCDYSYLNEVELKGHKRNNSLAFIIVQKFNLLATGRQRISNSMERDLIKSEPLYCCTIKGLLFKSLSLKKQQQKAYIKNGIKKYEKEVKEYNDIIYNSLVLKQLFLLLSEIVGNETDLKIIPNQEIQNQLKVELMTMIDKNSISEHQDLASVFDEMFLVKKTKVPNNSDLKNIFDSDLNNSVFNQVSIEEANSRGNIFFNEYLSFHNPEEKLESMPIPKMVNKSYKFPEIVFDVQ